MPTIKEIAKLANVSTATVSYVLNDPAKISEETRERVLKVIEAVNYKPNSIAKSLKVKKTNTIGIITEDITVFNTPEIIDGVDEYAESKKYHIILENIRLFKRIGNNYKDTSLFSGVISEITSVLLSKQVDGIIYVGAHCRDVTGLIGEIPIPVVYSYCYTSNQSDVSVKYDDESAAFNITNYLIENNHQKIGVITGLMDSIQCQERLRGFQRALFLHNILFNPLYVKTGNWERETGYHVGKELLSMPDRPTAVFALNDLMACGVIDAANELGVNIPKELSLVGFDNRECSYFYTPKITTMSLPLNQMGGLSAQVLIDIIEGNLIQREPVIKLQCELIERQSVMKIG